MLQTLTKQLKKKSKDQTVEFDEDHALDMVMNDMVEDLEVEPEGITEEELQQIIDESGIKETIAEIKDDFKDLDITLTDGLDELEKEEKKPFNFNFKGIKKAKPQGLIDQTMEQRTVKSEPKVEDSTKFKKGPLWEYRTNRSNDDKVID